MPIFSTTKTIAGILFSTVQVRLDKRQMANKKTVAVRQGECGGENGDCCAIHHGGVTDKTTPARSE
jgi:hypothetical protein